jgi:hypothetical protein
MTRLREPISAGEALTILLGVALFVMAQHWLGRLSVPQWLLLIVVLEFVVQPVSTLLHELGHAAAVVRLGGRAAHVIVGRGPWTNVTAGRVRVSFSPLPARGVRFGGMCRYDPSGLPWRSLGWIAIAGPAATLFELALLLALAPTVWGVGSLWRVLVGLSAAWLVASLIVNLSPRPLKLGHDRAAVAQHDGSQARRAFARHREGAPPPRLPTPPPANATNVDVSRSIPPPSPSQAR